MLPNTVARLRAELGFPASAGDALAPGEMILKGRRGGVTTEVILQALAYVADTRHDVSLLSRDPTAMVMLVKTAREYAVRLGLDPDKISAGRVMAVMA